VAKDGKRPANRNFKPIRASEPLAIVAVDLFTFDKVYLTLMDVFSSMPWVYPVQDKSREKVEMRYREWES
jgi:hypothetical protein